MSEHKTVQIKHALALFLVLLIIGLSLLLGFNHDPDTGAVTINPTFIIYGILGAILIYIALTFKGFRVNFPVRMRFCVSCGRNIPFDAVICPYCRHDYEK
ncbi:MAG: hypothetical protein JSW00_11055 [Thermoplasmata archaeon]|nr:MAG: hypothetical protein JSW00_11055 [Thermoplasmata archaeon]